MFFDLNISKDFDNFDKLKHLNGFCRVFNTNDDLVENEKGYTRLNVQLEELEVLKKIRRKFDVISVNNVSEISKTLLKMSVDIITVDYTLPNKITRPFLNMCKNKNIFIELVISDIKKDNKNKVLWLRSLRRILKYGGVKILIISSGASNELELKSETDIKNIVEMYNKRMGMTVVNNPIKCLRLAAMKKFTYQYCITEESDNDSLLSKDFLWNYYKLKRTEL